MQDLLNYSGQIAQVTPDGRSAVVALDNQIQGAALAVISPDTSGRIKLMNGKGALEAGVRVTGTAKRGPDALKAITVKAAL